MLPSSRVHDNLILDATPITLAGTPGMYFGSKLCTCRTSNQDLANLFNHIRVYLLCWDVPIV